MSTAEGRAMRFVEVDGRDDAVLRDWHRTYFAADTHDRPYPTPWMLEEVRADLTVSDTGSRTLLFSGVVDGDVVSAGMVQLPLQDNLHTAEVLVFTHPERRERGHGGEMLRHVEQVARAHGRTVVQAFADFPYDGPEDGGDHPSVRFLRGHGYEFGLGDVQRVLDLPVDSRHLDALVAEAAGHHQDYRLREFVDRCPDDIVESYGRLVGLLLSEAPRGEIDREAQRYDEERVRSEEAKLAAADRTAYHTVATGPGSEVVAYSTLVVPRHDPGRVYQWGTLVHPDHRGHRLGLAVKAHNLRLLQQHEPDARLVSTYNAAENAHMIGINERLGFRPVWRSGEFQKRLS